MIFIRVNIRKYIKIILDNHCDENLKNSKDRKIYMVDYFPKVVKSEKYFDYRDLILYKNKYSILDKPILAILKIFLYDENVYIQEKR